MASQIRNAALAELLDTDFVGRNEPNYAFKSATAIFTYLLGLRGFWPSVPINVGESADYGPSALHLARNGNTFFSQDQIVPYVDLDGAGDYLSHIDNAAFDIIGNEPYISATYRGLTIGGWFYPDVAQTHGLMTKGTGVAATSSYELYESVLESRFRVSTGAAFITVVGPDVTASVWQFIVGRYIPSTELKIWLNEVTATNVVAVPATLPNTAAPFNIGAFSGALLFDGRVGPSFLCTAALPDAIIGTLFQNTRTMFNV